MSELRAELPPALAGQRLDRAAAVLFPDYSRNCLQRWIRDGVLTVDGSPVKPRTVLAVGAVLCLCPPPPAPAAGVAAWRAVELPGALHVEYEDEHMIVLDKASGLVVHPAAGHAEDTLANALLARYPELFQLPRAGLVHRLDRDTSGLLVVARSPLAQRSLVAQLAARSIRREYLAIVNGVPSGGGSVDAPIGRHPRHRLRMAVRGDGRAARSHYRVLRRYRYHSLLRVRLETGRTHQIRVHLSHIGYPLVGDALYGARPRFPPAAAEALRERLSQSGRQALHAELLGLAHPATGEYRQWQRPLPDDLLGLTELLAVDAGGATA